MEGVEWDGIGRMGRMRWDTPNKDTGTNTEDGITIVRNECTEPCERV